MSKIAPIAMPICELADRLTIARLKMTRLADDQIDKNELQKQIAYYKSGIDDTDFGLAKLMIDL